MHTPPQELLPQLVKLAEIFESMRSCREHYVSPQQALPNLPLAHQCSQISRIFTALETVEQVHLDNALWTLENSYLQADKFSMVAGLRAARRALNEQIEHHNHEAA
ncbi:hypothetical protein K0504_16865 [Neiella marina]|uniref:Uncharacterized protein n=1 Tax=Neiella holothuriorum TaxID=2870530 RepID=A0ABS7EK33_9GAMM|nr:hypothetical protein [Neiella holothuriorum]MBW8192711.1 hypothetical protein [Neiella holothuriorum]